ncbi:MAG: hydrogenase maturation nickel metallochaperone HypA [Chloroflexota bacterium]
MHEFGITQDILAIALEKAGEAKASRITRINLVLGELSGIADECVSFYFELISKDTIASGADLVIERRPFQLRCPNCSEAFAPAGFDWSCPRCHEPKTEAVSGRECHMHSIEVE